MEIIYCSRCGAMVPPGGVDDGKYYLIAEEPVCIDCYAKLPPEQHTGATVLKAPKVEGRPPSTKLLGHPRRKPPSTHVIVATQRRPSDGHSAHKTAPTPKSRSAAGLFAVAAAFVILAAVILLVASGTDKPDRVGNYGTARPAREVEPPGKARPAGDAQPPEAVQPVVTTTPEGALVIPVEADTYVKIGAKSKSSGTLVWLTVSSTRRAYLRFDLSGLTGPIASARVRLRRPRAAGGKEKGFPVQAALVAENDWMEHGLSGITAPKPGEVLATWHSNVMSPEFDVTAQVRAALAAGKKLSLCISRTEGSDRAFFNYMSRESDGVGPQLIVVPKK